jgi:dephospho-CoA kinase
VAPPAGAGVPFIGLTGGLGAGKSEALRALGELGAATLSTDAVVHELLESDELRELLVERLGAGGAAGGRVDRSAVAERVFADPAQRGWLEGVLWPRVGERVSRWKGEVDRMQPPPRAAAVEVPLLFESGMEAVFDATIAVISHEETRSARAAARGHAAVEERAARQLTQQEKADKADFVVRNDGSLEELKQTLSQVLAKLDRA